MCVSKSRFLYEAVSESLVLAMLSGRVSKVWFVRLQAFINDFFSSLDIEFQWDSLQISAEKKLILTSPKLSEFHSKRYETYRNIRLCARKTFILFACSHLKHFPVSVSQTRKLKCPRIRLAEKNASVSPSPSLQKFKRDNFQLLEKSRKQILVNGWISI